MTILADSSNLYSETYYNENWISEKFLKHGGIPIFKCWESVIEYAYENGSILFFSSIKVI